MVTPTNPSPGTGAQATPAATRAGMEAALEDRSKHIRTMAKDMAALTGTAPAPTASPTTSADTSTPAREETVGGVTLPVAERPFFERLLSRDERDAEETVALPSMGEAAAIVEPAPPPPPPEPAPEREAILARLRQKVGQAPQPEPAPAPEPVPMPEPAGPLPAAPEPESAAPPPLAASAVPPAPAVPPPPPAPEVPAANPADAFPPLPASVLNPSYSAWPNIPAPEASVTVPPPPPIPEAAPEPYREPIEPPAPARPLAPSGLQTYSGDFSNRIDAQGSSTFSVLAAEQDARAEAPVALATPRRSFVRTLVPVIAGMCFFVLGAVGAFAAYQFVMTMRSTPIVALTVPSIVFADEYRELEGTGATLLTSLAASANGALVPGNVLVTYILTSTSDEEGGLIERPAGGAAFMRALQVPAPDILLRNIADASTIGVVNAGGETSAFFALRVDSYERTYAGMLTWEPLMLRDLGILYPLRPVPPPAPPATPEEDALATSTATSSVAATTTPSAPLLETPAPARTRFEDAIVANRDVRILRDTNGETLILYGYADKRTLIIARDGTAFEALLARLKPE